MEEQVYRAITEGTVFVGADAIVSCVQRENELASGIEDAAAFKGHGGRQSYMLFCIGALTTLAVVFRHESSAVGEFTRGGRAKVSSLCKRKGKRK